MQSRLGRTLETWRGDTPRTAFVEILNLSYTFVRAMEHGERFPSDPELRRIAKTLGLSVDELLIVAHCDRSPALAAALRRRGRVGARI